MTRSQVTALEKATREARMAFRQALRRHLLATPEMTAAEEDAARAQFIRDHFEWQLEVAELEEEAREARQALVTSDPAEPEGTADLEEVVENLRSLAKTPGERRSVKAYHRVSTEILELEEAAARQDGE